MRHDLLHPGRGGSLDMFERYCFDCHKYTVWSKSVKQQGRDVFTTIECMVCHHGTSERVALTGG